MQKSKSTEQNISEPMQTPPETKQMMEKGEEMSAEKPRNLLPEEVAIASTSGQGNTSPALEPPKADEIMGAIGAWLNDKRVTSLWCINQNRNSWIGIGGVGWKKLADNSDSSIVAMTMLASHARELNRRMDYREETDGKVYEMYIW